MNKDKVINLEVEGLRRKERILKLTQEIIDIINIPNYRMEKGQ